MGEPLVQIARSGVIVSSDDMVRVLAGRFAACHAITIERLLEPFLLEWVLRALQTAPFTRRVHERDAAPDRAESDRVFAVDMCLDDRDLVGQLMFLINDLDLFRLIERVTACRPIGCFVGTVFRLEGKTDQHDNWHDDMCQDRLVALSLNLSPVPFKGGVLQIRDRHTKRILNEVANTGLGDAVLFRISDGLQHRATAVEEGPARTVLAGWFCATPSYLETIKATRTVAWAS